MRGAGLSRSGQTAVEYMLATLALTIAFAGMYGFMQGQLKKLFTAAAVKILTAYY
jgi:Flp pilus assembly pilin Flp